MMFCSRKMFPEGTRSCVTRAELVRPDPSEDGEVTGLINARADAARRFAETQQRNFGRRLEQLHDEGERRASSMDVRMAYQQSAPRGRPGDLFGQVTSGNLASEVDYGQMFPSSFAFGERQSSAAGTHAQGSGSSAYESSQESPYAIWSNGFVNFAEDSGGMVDLDSTMVGVSTGIDYRFSNSFVGGVGVGYGRDRTEVGANGSLSRADAYSMALYGSYTPAADLFIDGVLGGSMLDFDSVRFVTPTGLIATGDVGGTQVFGSFTFAYERRDHGWMVSPYGRIAFSRSRIEGFREFDAGVYSLAYGDQRVDSLSASLGLRAYETIELPNGLLRPELRGEYGYDFADRSSLLLGYADLSSLTYSTVPGRNARHHFDLSLLLDLRMSRGWGIGIGYRTRVGSGSRMSHTVDVRIEVQF